jgi:hypothetical protein
MEDISMSSVKATASGILETADSTGVMEVLSSGGFGLKVATDGRVYGDRLHNVGTVTGTTDQFIASGTYTPTLTGVANITGLTAYDVGWIRVGNRMQLTGRVDVDPTAAGVLTTFRMSLPIASAIGNPHELGGVGGCDAGEVFQIYGNTTNDDAQFSNNAFPTAAVVSCFFSLGYTIL